MYRLTKKCPKKVIVQHLESGDYDLSDCGSLNKAIENEMPTERDFLYIKDDDIYEGKTDKEIWETIRMELVKTIKEYTQEETLQSAIDGYGWAINLKFVEEIED